MLLTQHASDEQEVADYDTVGLLEKWEAASQGLFQNSSVVSRLHGDLRVEVEEPGDDFKGLVVPLCELVAAHSQFLQTRTLMLAGEVGLPF